jgi:DNA polymerase III subunit delta
MIYKSFLLEQNNNLINEKIFLFYGENLGLKIDFKNQIKKNNNEAEVINLTQDDIIKDIDLFFSNIFNTSLFANKKIYIVDQANDKLLEIIKEIESKIDDQKIYLFADILEKKSKLRNYFEKSKSLGISACYADNEINIKKILLSKLKKFEGLSAENINMIIKNSNLDRVKLNNEIGKILIYFKNKKIIKEELTKLLDIRVNDDFSILKDVALNGNKIKTNDLLNSTIIDADKSIFYLSVINQRLFKLAELLKHSKKFNLDNAINMIKPNIFWKDKPIFLEQSKKWNIDKIRKLLSYTYSLEIKFKSNALINKDTFIKKLLVDICIIANPQ